MKSLLDKTLKLGNIIGLGESSHGSHTEFEWKLNWILKCIKDSPQKKYVFFFEGYEEPMQALQRAAEKSLVDIDDAVYSCLNEQYEIWQTREFFSFFVALATLIRDGQAEIHIHGIDYFNSVHKASPQNHEIAEGRNIYMHTKMEQFYQDDAVCFLSAHNSHIGRYYEPLVELGSLLSKSFGDKYIPIAQYAFTGSIRAMQADGQYRPVDFSYNTQPNFLACAAKEILRKEEGFRPLILPTNDNRLRGSTEIEQAGFLWPLERPWYKPFGAQYFDYVIIHQRSSAAAPMRD